MSDKLKVLEYEMRKIEFEECKQQQLEFIYRNETEEHYDSEEQLKLF